jgi:two-component system sensor histidine kinase TctE
MKTVQPISLRRLLLMRLWVPLLGLMLIGAVLSFIAASYFANLVYDQWLYDSAMTLATQVHGNGSQAVVALPSSAVQMLEWDRVDRVFYEVTTARGGRIFGNSKLPVPVGLRRPEAVSAGLAGQADTTYFNIHVGQAPVRAASVTITVPDSNGDRATVTVGETIAKRNAVVRSILSAVLPIESGLLILAGISIWIAVRSTLRSMDTLAGELARVEPEALRPLVAAEPIPQEVAPLVNALNTLIARLAEARDASTRFVANAAHQLRTPLAAIQLQTQRALREPDPKQRQEALVAADKAVQRLGHLTHQLLSLARAEPGGVPAQTEDVDVALLAREEVEHWADAAIARDMDLGYEGPIAGLCVNGDRQLLGELIGNLLDNAIRYGRPGGRITLRLLAAPLRLSVEDDGPGIPAAERGRVLERFYRLPTTAESGSGLGLTIANEIAARHGARLEITDGPGGTGTAVTITYSQPALV